MYCQILEKDSSHFSAVRLFPSSSACVTADLAVDFHSFSVTLWTLPSPSLCILVSFPPSSFLACSFRIFLFHCFYPPGKRCFILVFFYFSFCFPFLVLKEGSLSIPLSNNLHLLSFTFVGICSPIMFPSPVPPPHGEMTYLYWIKSNYQHSTCSS